MFRKRMSGFTLQSLLIAVALSAILIASGYGAYSVQVAKTLKQTTTTDLTMMASGFQAAMSDIGAPQFEVDQVDQFKNYLSSLEEDHVGVTFNQDSVGAITNGFKVDGVNPLDAYKQPYHFRFTTADGKIPSVMIISYGPNLLSDETGYDAGSFGDDIVAVVTFTED